MSCRVAVLGGGISGVVVANELSRHPGFSVSLFEQSPRLGGLHRSAEVDGVAMDIGAFIFDRGHELLESFPFLKDAFVPLVPRQVRISPQGTLDRYPITAGGYWRDNGSLVTAASLLDLLASKVRYRSRDSVSSFIKYYTGGTIYRRSGLQRYVKRLYGLDDDEIGLEFARQRMSYVSDHTLSGKARVALRELWERQRGAVYTPAWVRPAEGFGRVYAEIGRHLAGRGVDCRLGCGVEAVRPLAEGGYEVVGAGAAERFDRVVSTVPVPVMLRLLGEEPRARLATRSLLSLFYKGRLPEGVNVFFNFTADGHWKRLTNFSSFYALVPEQSHFTVEVTLDPDGERDPAFYADEFAAHITGLGFCRGAPELLGHTVTPNAYPVYRPGDAERVRSEKARLLAFGVDLIGRQGSFEYLSSAQAAAKAKALARGIAEGHARAPLAEATAA